MTERAHSTCELCRAGVPRDTGTHHDKVPGTEIARFRRCTAKCASCKKVFAPGDQFRVVRLPEGEVEVHEACLG